MIKACIFDLDGTLTDTLSSIAYSTNRMLAKEGLMPLPRNDYRFYAGNGAVELVKACLRHTKRAEALETKAEGAAAGSEKRTTETGQTEMAQANAHEDADRNMEETSAGEKEKEKQYEADTKALFALPQNPGALTHSPDSAADFSYYFDSYLHEFSKYCMYQVQPFPGIVPLLKTMKQRGIRIAVLSNKPDAQVKTVVSQVFGAGFFDAVSGQKEGIPRKPSPIGALHIAQEFGAAPSDCLYFGDTNTDMQTGNAAGMHTVGVLWGFRDREELEQNHAEAIVEKPAEILKLL